MGETMDRNQKWTAFAVVSLGLGAAMAGSTWLALAAAAMLLSLAMSYVPSRPRVPPCGVPGCRSNVATHTHAKPKPR